MFKRLTTCCVGATLFVLTFGPTGHAEASEAGASATSVLQNAKVGLGPLPGTSVLGPVEIETFDQLISRHAWPMPRQRSWPVDDDGQPVVDTRRADELWHTVNSWDSLSDLRRRYRRTTQQLRELNPDADLRDLEEGDEILVWRRDDDRVSESRGDPQAGRLIAGEPVPNSGDYVLQYPHRSFGTYYTVSETVRVLDAYYEQFPDADPLIVGDLSFRTGRHIGPHASHQSGRDIDITLPRHEPPPNYDRFYTVTPDNLDAEKTLWLLTELIAGGYVEYIFLDWRHQRTLWQLAEQQGAPDEWLETVFQYPSHQREGLIRNEPGHDGHFHVRFACQHTDEICRP